jgi:hypothetical protein
MADEMSSGTGPEETQKNDSPSLPLPHELLEWARKRLDEEEAAAALREIRETGSFELSDFIHELEQEVMRRE